MRTDTLIGNLQDAALKLPSEADTNAALNLIDQLAYLLHKGDA